MRINQAPQNDEEEKYRDALRYVEVLFPLFPGYNDFRIADIISKMEIDASERRKMRECASQIEQILRDSGYIQTGKLNLLVCLTQRGVISKKQEHPS
jgi:hypothetical protein